MQLSIITINYNDAEGLRKTLASVSEQTYPHIQHIIVDGGSTDGSVEIIREYENNQCKVESVKCKGMEDVGANEKNNSTPIYTTLHNATPPKHHVLWVSEKDKGIYNAMNKGIEIALGKRIVNDDHTSAPIVNSQSPIAQTDYIQILNAGDTLAAPDVTERMVNALLEVKGERLKAKGPENGEADTPASHLSPLTSKLTSDSAPASRLSPLASRLENCPAIFYGNMTKVNAAGQVIGKSGYTEYSLRQFYSSTLNHDCAYIRADLFEEYGLYDEKLKIVSDWKWYLQAIGLGQAKPEYVDIDVTIFDAGGISETNLELRNKERRKVLEELMPPAVLWDYDQHAFEVEQVNRLRRWHLYPLVYFMERLLFKLEKWGMLKR